ncbi:MAG: acyl-CoA dehydrogenase family protein [Isosphaeraceae bacterium]|nr:acyl-CoA dehydrogenase family protein [Isosphaeraceae bacterium]
MTSGITCRAELDGTVRRLAAEDGPADLADVFPEALWSALVEAGAPKWSLPKSVGGEELDRLELLDRYRAVAEGSLAAAFILSQHDAAARRLVAVSERPAARIRLPRIAAGTEFCTIGVSQLTTSRRLGSAALRAREAGGGRYLLDGAMPWVTAADRADLFVTGAVLDDGRQILAALPSDRAGLDVRPPLPLAALAASRTTEVVCREVFVEPEDLLGGPAIDVMAHINAAGTGGLETSALAIGQAYAAISALELEADEQTELVAPARLLRSAADEAWDRLVAAARGGEGAPSSAAVRGVANGLVMRATQAHLSARRGRGLLLSDPAQRWARQALFFLVWSCPTPIAHAAIRDLAEACSL